MLRYVCIAIIVLLTACQSDDRVREANPEESQPTAVRSFNPGSLVGHHYFMDEQHSYLGFKIKYFGYSPVRGRFDVFDGTLFYDPEYPAATSATVFIDVSSIHTGQERRDEDLLREDTWFDAVDHPYISFYSTEAIPYENGSFDLIGEITVKGISRMDTLSFDRPTDISRDWAENEQVDFSGKMTIDRQDFEVFG
ncbi:MAG: YceI family protein, partial [Flavobacteriales bacterium]|nr:YceI family protein [Flavobacteriales bacterium]